MILSQPRTGSTLLCLLLDQYPTFDCFTELFSKDGLNILSRYKSSLSSWNVEKRDQSPTLFLNTITKITGDNNFIFKFFPEHGLELLDNIMTNLRPKGLILSRRNKLAQYASLKTAIKSGVWNKQYPSEIKINDKFNQKPLFSEREFRRFIFQTENIDEYFKKTLIRHNLEYKQIFYEDLLKQEEINRISKYVDPDVQVTEKPLDYSTVKLGMGIVSYRFHNHQKVIKFLEKNNLMFLENEI